MFYNSLTDVDIYFKISLLTVGLIINIATTLLLVYCCPTATERSFDFMFTIANLTIVSMTNMTMTNMTI